MSPDHVDDAMTAPTTILAIESDPADEWALFQSAADGSRYQLSIARSVAEARSLLAAHTFDVILTIDCLPDGTASDLMEQFSDQAVVFCQPKRRSHRVGT